MHSVLRVIAGQQCPDGTIGRGDTNTGKARRDNQFYINRGNPATCDGMITSFSYCYHRPDETDNDYQITFALYRNINNLEFEYRNVSQTIVLRKTHSDVEKELVGVDFACSELTMNQPLTVQMGDVLGACVVDPPSDSVYCLDIAGRHGSGEASGNLLRAERAPAGCTETSVPRSFDFATITEHQDITSSRVLHISATISRYNYVYCQT